ncbi:protein of unknown function [Methylorubrum extorquens]|uniref:Uncharacterized protein n=1 Tax=Methylorubrum extorquens TaxID=408 RepID=A0A2N9AVK3_METEX|nr:protein of unknown function [Methylorubrum extorquens]
MPLPSTRPVARHRPLCRRSCKVAGQSLLDTDWHHRGRHELGAARPEDLKAATCFVRPDDMPACVRISHDLSMDTTSPSHA